jgi:hypothetical protein
VLEFEIIQEFRERVRRLEPSEYNLLHASISKKLAYLEAHQVEGVSYQDEAEEIQQLKDLLAVLDSESAKVKTKERPNPENTTSEIGTEEVKKAPPHSLDAPPPMPVSGTYGEFIGTSRIAPATKETGRGIASPDEGQARRAGKRNSFAIEGEMVKIRFEGCDLSTLKVTVGFKYLAYLVSNQGIEFKTPAELENALQGDLPSEQRRAVNEITRKNAGELGFSSSGMIPIDRNSEVAAPLRNLKTRLDEIDCEIGGAELNNDKAQLQNLQGEKENILKEVKRITARSRRKTDYAPETKKAINRVRNALTRAIALIGRSEDGKALAEHFRQTLFPFSFPYTYNPQPPINWNQ